MGEVTDDEHGVGEPAAGTMNSQPTAPEPAGDQQRNQTDREGDQDVASGQLEFGQVADDREGGEQSEGGIDDRAVFLGAVPQHPWVVCRMDVQRGQPQDDDADRDPGVFEGDERGRRVEAVGVGWGAEAP